MYWKMDENIHQNVRTFNLHFQHIGELTGKPSAQFERA
jgi:hypothetical protein